MNFKNKSFCVLPFIHLNSTTGGLYRYCCIMPNPALDKNEKPITLYNHSIEEAWNSDEIKKIRLAMLKGEKIDHCRKCYDEEKYGEKSLRLDYNQTWLESDLSLIERRCSEAEKNEGKLESGPVFVELKFSNLCNLKCRMCSPFDSSSIDKEYDQISNENAEFARLWSHRKFTLYNKSMPLKDLPVWHKADDKLNQFINLLPDLRKIHFAGGEPTLHSEFLAFLELAVASGHAGKIDLSYNTNLTKISDQIINTFKFFKSVNVHISLDGYSHIQEYIRFPSKWSIIEKNIKSILEKNTPCRLIISPTVQIYNLFELIDLFKFIDEINLTVNQKISVTPNILDNPNYFNFRILPFAIRSEAANLWRQYAEQIKENDWFKGRILSIASIIDDKSYIEDKRLISEFLYITKILDKYRSQKFETLYPNLFEKIKDIKI